MNIGIRQLVEFCCRNGDLGYADNPGVKALEGVQTHQKIQKRYRQQAESEVTTQLVMTIDDEEIELGGRIDLLFSSETPPRIEEIKTVYAHTPGTENDAVHWGQLKFYGASYAREKDLDQVNLSLNLVNLFSNEEQRHAKIFQRGELEDFVETILRRYLDWQNLVEQQQQRTREQAQEMAFPFENFRQQQHRFAAEVYRNVQKQDQLIVEAPTGAGKTISTLFPVVKAIGEDLCDQVVYLSAKVSGQQQAISAIRLMPVELSFVVIQAKARSCPCNHNAEEIDPEGRCRRCLGFFERLPAAREQLFNQRQLDVNQIQKTADEFQICPFELSLQMINWVDIIICDYNYVFDPLVQLSYFQTSSKRKTLLIDELHNLVDRARGMYSAKLTRTQIKQAASADNSQTITSALESLQFALDRELRQQSNDESISERLPDSLLRAIQRFSEALGFDIFGNKHLASETIELSKAVFRFQTISQLFDDHHRVLGRKPLPAREIKLLCLNAFDYLEKCYPLFQSVCGFSATLSPSAYFECALGFTPSCANLKLPSPFPAQNLKVCIADYVDTRYRQREFSIDAICQSITSTYQAKPGNYLVFFSSYYFMQSVQQRFAELYPEIEILIQQRDFDDAAQQQFLTQFFEHDQQLGFAIMGGRFAEGIDYQGKSLIGTIIVGVGLPQANQEQQLIQQDFDRLKLDGFDYAFRFPGLIRVMQSAGRVIRSEKDQGVVVLLDQRFCQAGYRRYLPPSWQPQSCPNIESLEQALADFWRNSPSIPELAPATTSF